MIFCAVMVRVRCMNWSKKGPSNGRRSVFIRWMIYPNHRSCAGGRLASRNGTSVSISRPAHCRLPPVIQVTAKPTCGPQLWYNIVRNYDLKACIATFETRPRPHYHRMLRQFYGGNAIQHLSPEKIEEADNWIRGHYLFLQHPDHQPTLESLLGQAETAVYRYGAKIIQIDPFNRLEAQREPKESETDYIGRCLRAVFQFAQQMQVHVQILAHPSKTDAYSRGKMPTLEDIHGSKHWDNMPDAGFSIWRPALYDDDGNRETYAELHHLKARYDDLGYPSRFGLNFDFDLQRFGTCQLPKKKPKTTKDDGRQDDGSAN